MQPRGVSLAAGPSAFNTIHADRALAKPDSDLRQNFVPQSPSGVTFAVIDWLNALCGSGESYSDAIIRVARG